MEVKMEEEKKEMAETEEVKEEKTGNDTQKIEDTKKEEAKTKSKSKKGLIIAIIIIVVLVLIGASIGGYFLYKKIQLEKPLDVAWGQTYYTYLKSIAEDEGKKEAFYDEVLRALWGYLSDKLNIPVANLTKDNVEAELDKYGISSELSKTFMDILKECEFARYAPVQGTGAMDKLYKETVSVIEQMENTIKK